MKTLTHKNLIVLVLTPIFLFQNFGFLATAQEEHKSLLVSPTTQREIQEPQELKMTDSLNMVVGDVDFIETRQLARIAVTNPEIVDISDAKADKINLVAKKPGQTEVFVWDEAGKRSITVRVAIENLDNLMDRVNEVLLKAQIKDLVVEKNEYEGKVMVSGAILKQERDALEKVLEPFSDRIINLVKNEVSEQLVQIDMQVTELSTTLVKQIGLDWTTNTTDSNVSGGSGTSATNSTSTTGNGLNLKYDETSLPPKGNIFNVSSFARTTPIEVAVNALVQEGKGKILSKPRLVVLSGKEASFLVGGEVPIRTTTTNSTGGQSQDNVSFKQYGVNMTITPTIHGDKIDILLNVQISDIDKATTNSQGDVGYITRSAQTQLYLDDKQTIVLAGLIKHTQGETVRGLPWLSKMPVVGGLFRTRSNGNPDTDTELVISLTPTILKTKKMATEQVVMPSKRVEGFAKEIEKNFEKESLVEPVVKAKEMPEVKKVTEVKAPAPVMPQPVAMPASLKSKEQETIVTSYVRSVQLKISKAISYPYEAIQKKWEGSVKLRLRILKDGTLVDADVMESSGHDVFDKDALNTAKIVAPFTSFPQNMQQNDVVITVPIVYSQK